MKVTLNNGRVYQIWDDGIFQWINPPEGQFHMGWYAYDLETTIKLLNKEYEDSSDTTDGGGY